MTGPEDEKMRPHQLLLVLAGLTLALASCGARGAAPAGDTSGHCDSPDTESVGANQSEQPAAPEAAASVSAWILVDGMTKLQGIT